MLQEEIENSVNYEYLKNILISYFITNDSSVHANLLRVVFVAMKFTSEEQKRVTEAFNMNNLEKLKPLVRAMAVGETFGDGYFGQFVKNNLNLTREVGMDKVIDLLIDKKVDYVFGYENSIYEQMMTRNLGTTIQVLNTYPTRSEGFLAFSKRSKCSAELRQKFAEQVALAQTKRRNPTLLTKYREVFNESLTRPK